jgi:hypothetical protein
MYDHAGYAVARFVEELRYSSIPEGITGFVNDIILPVTLRSWCRHSL